jgi:hypothetical protein
MIRFLRRPLRGAVPIALVLAAACTDNPVAPEISPEPRLLATIECRVVIADASMTCSYPEAVLGGSAIRTSRMFGGQDRYVKLSNYGNTVVGDVLSMNVTVQNLLADALGDGTPAGVQIFFAELPSNGVTVANATGNGMFLNGEPTPYFLYNQVLATYEVSEPLNWQFNLNGGSGAFTFQVAVYSSQADETQSLLDLVWDGSVDTDWGEAGNWTPAVVPDLTKAVQIQAGGALSNLPVLSANGQAGALLVAAGRTLGVSTYDLEVAGNVDASGTISGSGSVTMTGSGSLLRGNIPSLFVTGSTSLQGATRTTGAVSVTGSLTVADSALSISIP